MAEEEGLAEEAGLTEEEGLAEDGRTEPPEDVRLGALLMRGLADLSTEN